MSELTKSNNKVANLDLLIENVKSKIKSHSAITSDCSMETDI